MPKLSQLSIKCWEIPAMLLEKGGCLLDGEELLLLHNSVHK